MIVEKEEQSAVSELVADRPTANPVSRRGTFFSFPYHQWTERLALDLQESRRTNILYC